MPIKFTKGCYPYTTVVQDWSGCLHVFKGCRTPTNSPTLPLVYNYETKKYDLEAEVFFQSQSDIEAIFDCLPEEEKELLNKGYTICTKHIPDDYFIQS